MQQFTHTVLLVEDDQSILILLEYIFKKEFNVILAENGRIAFEKIKEQKPDIIVSDIMMPELNGIELKEKLNLESETANIPFIFLTAINDEVTKDKINKLGVSCCMVKPVKPNELRDKVKEVMNS